MGKTTKKSYDEVYEFFKSKGLKLLDTEYIGNNTKMVCVDRDGYKVVATYANMKTGQGARRFYKSNPYTIENIHKYIKVNRDNVKLISTEYISACKNKLVFKCLIHNKEFKMAWNSFQQGGGCPVCAGNIRLDIEVIKQRITEMKRDSEVELVSTEYASCDKDKLIFKCLSHNNEFHMRWSDFQNGQGCKLCGYERISGENHYFWKGGVTSLHNHLRNSILPWKVESFKKYNRKCDITNIGSNENIIHHLHPFSEILKETMSILNLPIHKEINQYTEEELKSIENKCLELHCKYGLGVCLTEEIHKEFHSIYGRNKGGNTKDQYIEFKEMKLKQLNKVA